MKPILFEVMDTLQHLLFLARKQVVRITSHHQQEVLTSYRAQHLIHPDVAMKVSLQLLA
jgi:hypothetical protein